MKKIDKFSNLNISEDGFEEITDIICSSMESVFPVAITFVSNPFELVIGFIHFYNEEQSYIRVIDFFDECYEIPLNNIVYINKSS